MSTRETPIHEPLGAKGGDAPTQETLEPRADGLLGRLVGEAIDAYTLHGVLGEGGMGVVFEAQQERPIRRRVALKVIKPGMDSEAVLSRFEVERQALAVMDHPNIARVIDGGATERGLPYFVMDLVRGVPITDFCDRHRLGIPERLELFMSVCRAVQHAHSKGVIHRDLKPSNILVEYAAGVATAKVIDFGVAKAVGQRIGDRSVHTQQGQLIGTPEYMSPEQAEMSGLDIDTRTDVYALGVVLYELVAGVTPLDAATVRNVPSTELHRLIRECETPRPSTRLGQIGAPADGGERTGRIASARRLTVEELSLELRRDLDWIVLRCLEKDRERRYPTPAAIEEDLRRYLSNEPVQAGPPDLAYRARKFLRRNRGAAVAGSCVLGVLLLGGASTLAGMIWAMREEDRAFAESARAQQAEAEARAALIAAEEAQRSERQARLDAEHERGRTQLALARSLVGTNEFAKAAELLGAIRGSVPEHEWWWTAWACARGARVTTLLPAAAERSNAAGGGGRSFSRDGALVGVFGAVSEGPERVFRFVDGNAAAAGEWKDGAAAPIRMGRDQREPIEVVSPDGSLRVVLSNEGRFLTALGFVRADGSREAGQRIEHGDHDPLFWIDWGRLSVSSTRGDGAIEVRTRLDTGGWEVEQVRGLERPAQALWHDAASRRVRVLYDDGSLAEMRLAGSGPKDVSEIARWLPPSDADEFWPDDGDMNHALTTRKLAFDASGSTLYAGSYRGWVTAFDTRSRAMLWKRKLHPAKTRHRYQYGALAVAPDGLSLLASAIGSPIVVLDARSGEPMGQAATTSGIGHAAFAGGDGRLVFTPAEGSMAVLAPGGAVSGTFADYGKGTTVYDIDVSPDGARIAAALHLGVTGTPTSATGGELVVFENADPPRRLWSRPLVSGGRAAAFSPDGTLVACTERGAVATLWDAATGEARGALRVYGNRGHVGVVSGVAFHPKAPVLATATHDDVVRLWSTTSGLLLAEIPLSNLVQSHYFSGRLKDVRFHPSGDALAIAFEERVLWLDLRRFDGVIEEIGRR